MFCNICTNAKAPCQHISICCSIKKETLTTLLLFMALPFSALLFQPRFDAQRSSKYSLDFPSNSTGPLLTFDGICSMEFLENTAAFEECL